MRTRGIGRHASALTRFHFVRALLASALVNIPIVFTVFCVEVAIGEAGLLNQSLALFVAAVLIGSIIVLLTVSLNILDRLHRRLLALFSLYSVLLFPLSLVVTLDYWHDSWKSQLAAHPFLDFLITLFILAATALAIVLFVELGCLAVWAILAPKAAYLSVRGWRPSWLQPVRNLTHQLGFPAFVAQIRRGQFSLAGLYGLIAVLNVVFFGVLTAGLWFPRANNPAAQSVDLAILLAIPIGALLLQLVGVGAVLDKVTRRHAAELYQSVREWDDRPPVLFLRSFEQDKVPIRARTRNPVLQMPAGLGRPRELDELILEAGAPYGPIIAIGDPRNPVPPLGAARVFVRNDEQDWKDVVSDLIAASRAIVICPHTTSGVAWEIEQVRPPDVLARTIVIAAPNMSAEDTRSLFAEIAGGQIKLRPRQRAVAAFQDPAEGWTLLSARRLTVQTYTLALNRALRSLLQPEPRRPARRDAAATSPTTGR